MFGMGSILMLRESLRALGYRTYSAMAAATGGLLSAGRFRQMLEGGNPMILAPAEINGLAAILRTPASALMPYLLRLG